MHKSKQGAVDAQLSEAARYTGWPVDEKDALAFTDIAFAPAHDRLDAYLSAWVAALPEEDRVALGSLPVDVIWVPKVKDSKFVKPTISKTSLPGKTTASPSSKPAKGVSLICPACGEHRFKRWPFGWDSHAAHRCIGLKSKGAQERKAEFKSRFSHLFR